MNREKHSTVSAKQMGWDADSGQIKRRQNIFDKCRGNALKASRILQNTAMRGGSDDIRRKARNDARYFFNMHERRKERMRRREGVK